MIVGWGQDRERLGRLESSIDEVRHALERVELMFLMKDPSVPAGADAYEGLRRSLILAREDRMAHLVDLARIDASLQRADGAGGTEAVLSELLTAAGVERVDSPTGEAAALFEMFGSAEDGSELEVLEPAYVHPGSGALIRMGRARYADAQPAPPSGTPVGLGADDRDESDGDPGDQDDAATGSEPVGSIPTGEEPAGRTVAAAGPESTGEHEPAGEDAAPAARTQGVGDPDDGTADAGTVAESVTALDGEDET